MPEDLFKDERGGTQKTKKLSYFSVLFALALLVFSALFVYKMIYNADKFALKDASVKEFDYSQVSRGSTSTKSSLGDSAQPAFNLYFVGADKGGNYFPTLGYYNSQTKRLEKVPKFDKSSILEFASSGNFAVALIVRQEDLQKSDSVYKAARFFYDTDFAQDRSFKNSREIKVLDEKPFYIRGLSLCSGSVFFSATETAGGASLPPFEKWYIYRLNLKKGQIERLTKGAEAICLSGDSFIYLASDGLRFYDLKNKESTLLRRLAQVPDYQFLALSGDKKILFWSFPTQRLVRVLQFLSFEPPILRDVKLIKNTVALSPVLSKSGKYALYLSTDNLKRFRNNFDKAQLSLMQVEKGSSHPFAFPIELFDLKSFRLLELLGNN